MKNVALIAVACLTLTACEDDQGQEYVNAVESARCGVSGVVINDNSIAIRESNESVQWSASVNTNIEKPADCNYEVEWSSDDTDIAVVSSSGMITTLNTGVANIRAAVGRFSSSQAFTVSDATIQSINLEPSSVSLDECRSETVTATGVYSDGTTRNISDLAKLNWSTDDTDLARVANVSASGITVLASASGSGTLTAAYEDSIDNSAALTVLDTLSNITLSPITLALNVGDSSTITAEGSFSDGSSADISQNSEWSLTAAAQASFVSLSNSYGDKGAITATGAGVATVTVECGGLSAFEDATVNVTVAATLESVAFSSTADPLYLTTEDDSESLTLNATYSDGSVADVTESATWEAITGDDDFIDIDDDSGDKGEIILASNIADITEDKSVIVRATFDGATAQVEIIVVADDE